MATNNTKNGMAAEEKITSRRTILRIAEYLKEHPPLLFAIAIGVILETAGALGVETLRILAVPLLFVLVAGLFVHVYLQVRRDAEPWLHGRYGITIDDPRDGADLGEKVRVKGGCQKSPPPGTLRLFTRVGTRLWPQQVAHVFPNGHWEATVYLGGTAPYEIDIVVAVVGQSAQALCEYYKKVGEELKAAGRHHVPLDGWPRNAVEQKSVHVTRV